MYKSIELCRRHRCCRHSLYILDPFVRINIIVFTISSSLSRSSLERFLCDTELNKFQRQQIKRICMAMKSVCKLHNERQYTMNITPNILSKSSHRFISCIFLLYSCIAFLPQPHNLEMEKNYNNIITIQERIRTRPDANNNQNKIHKRSKCVT